MSTQYIWAQALLDPARAAPNGLTTWNHSDPARRLAVHRNNVVVSLVDALAQSFPVTQQLVGEDFFRAMAQVFVRAHPPGTRALAHYGDALPGFITQFSPAAGLPYLADVAQLEALRMQALHAADAAAIDPAVLATLLQDADTLPKLRWQLAPSLHLLRSPHAVVSVWAAHQAEGGIALERVNLALAESALVFRSGLNVMVLQADVGTASLVENLLNHGSLGEAVDYALCADPAFDPPQSLALLIRHELLVSARATHGAVH